MNAKILMCTALVALALWSGAALAQDPADDPFGGGFSVNYKAEVLTMGVQNDSLHSWAYRWLSEGVDSLELRGNGSFPESYLRGDNRDIAQGDFNGDYMDEVVVVWDSADGGVFVGIPTIDPATLQPDPGRWNLPDVPLASGVLYATPVLADVLGEVRVVAGNFYDDRAEEFVLAYLAVDGTVTLTVFDVVIDVDSLILTAMASISDQAVNTALPALQQFGAVSRFDIATGDFDGDGLDEVALVANDPAQNPETDLALKIYKFNPVANTLDPTTTLPIAYAANADINHPCLRSVLIETGNFEPDSLDEITILDSWSRNDVDSSRVGTLHTVKLNTDMDGIADFQMQSLPRCSWQNDWGFYGPKGAVNSMTTYDNELVVGGQFTLVGGVLARNIASWNGTKWKPLGAGVNYTVEALEVYQGDLIVGGCFTEAGGVPAKHLARWDGSSWEEFGGGADNCVLDLLASNSVSPDTLFACGWFAQVGATQAHRIARWDGSAWHTVGSGGGLNDAGMDMMEWNGRIVVTGLFTYLGGHYIFSWIPSDPDNWHIFGGGLFGNGNALENIDGTLIVGGGFTSVYGMLWEIPAKRLAYWAGSWWSSYGSPGLNDTVNALLFDDATNALYVGGRFTTAGDIDASGIARFAVGSSTWAPLGSGLTDVSGYSEVQDLCLYRDELIVGGQFDHAGDIITGGLARWDGSQWHALCRPDSVPPLFTIGLAVGRFDAESKLDNIAITVGGSETGFVNQYLRIYDVDPESAPLTLSMEGETTISGEWINVEELVRSRRLIAIDDITGDGQVDLAVLTSQFPSRIEIYKPCDSLNNCTFYPMPRADVWASPSVNPSHLVSADLDSATIMLGKPTYYRKTDLMQPLVVLNTPPVHFDVLNDKADTVDLNFRYLENPDNCETYSVYQKKSGYTVEMSTEIKNDWGISSGLDMAVGGTGYVVKANLNARFGEQFSNTEDSGHTIQFTATVQTGDDDQIYATQIDYDIWEYPIFRGGVQLEGNGVLVVAPSISGDVFSAAKNPDREQFIPNHEVENVLSYPRYVNLTDNPLVASEHVLTKGNTGWVTDEYPWSLKWAILQTDFTTDGVETEWNAGVDVGASVQAGGSYLGYGFGVSVGVNANYSHEELQTQKTTVTDACSLAVFLGCINTGYGVCNYTVRPYAYWANNGALVLDFTTDPQVSPNPGEETWWQDQYGQQDPAFVLPWRLDDVKGEPLASEEARYKTREIIFHPEKPSPGEVVTITARIHNFGLEPIPNPIGVSFYIGDPANGGQLLYGTGGDSIFYTPGGLLSQCDTMVTAEWRVPDVGSITRCQRIWALIDPLDEISPEVHDNGDWATNNKGWKLLYVDTDNNCPYDADQDGWVAPAYQCCNEGNQWDNCPDVANPYQEDSDSNGIGDSCEVMVYMCGDANGDETIDIGDAVHLINYIFKSGPPPNPLCAGDANGDNEADIGDPVHLINYIFKSGPPPVEDCCM